MVRNILILDASFGSLPATRTLTTVQNVTLANGFSEKHAVIVRTPCDG
jgi:hypothetical protein